MFLEWVVSFVTGTASLFFLNNKLQTNLFTAREHGCIKVSPFMGELYFIIRNGICNLVECFAGRV